MISKDQVYESADPRDDGRRILVKSYYPDYTQASIVSYPSGKNHRSVNVRSLHQDRNTGKGTPRKNGYFLVGMREEIEATAEQNA